MDDHINLDAIASLLLEEVEEVKAHLKDKARKDASPTDDLVVLNSQMNPGLSS